MQQFISCFLANTRRCKHVGLQIGHVPQLAILSCLILFLAAPGIYGAGKWSDCGVGHENIRSLAIDPQNPAIVYAGIYRLAETYGGAVYKSINGCSGEWIFSPTGTTSALSVQELAVDPKNPATVYAGTYGGVYKSTDGGMSWNATGLSHSITALAVNPQNPVIIYAGTYGQGVFKSIDGGMNWIAVNNNLSNQLVQALVIDPQDPAILYVGTQGFNISGTLSGGVYKSTNAGESWTAVNSGLSDTFITALAINPKMPATVYAATDRKGVFKSGNGGFSWTYMGPGSLLAIDPQNPATLYTAYQSAGVFKSTNAGASWIPLGGGAPTVLAIDPAEPRRIYAGYYYGGVKTYTSGRSSMELMLSSGGAASANTIGADGPVQSGYASIEVHSGATPYGTAVFGLKQNGVTVSEAAVPASLPSTLTRVFIDYRAAVYAVPGRSEAGKIDVNTGLAIVNNGPTTAGVTYTLRNASGAPLTTGHGTLTAGKHIACFIDQLNENGVPDFNLPPDFQTAIQFGSLEIASTQPLSVLALRGTTNQRNEFLLTTTPIADLTQTLGNDFISFPQFVDGGGYTTSLILLNTSDVSETGKLEILDKNGNPLTVNQVGNTRDSSFNYSIEPGGLFRFQTDGSASGINTGWVRLTPDAGNPTPVGSEIFGYNPNDALVSESGIPAASATTHARVYVDLSNSHNTGLAISNVSNTSSNITINAYQRDGVTAAGIAKPAIPLGANGQTAAFADEFVAGLPVGFTGVLDISSTLPFAALTLRSLMNERDEFLMTTFPIADANKAAPSPLVFPQIADGGGYATEIILISAAQSASTAIDFYDENGMPTDFGE